MQKKKKKLDLFSSLLFPPPPPFRALSLSLTPRTQHCRTAVPRFTTCASPAISSEPSTPSEDSSKSQRRRRLVAVAAAAASSSAVFSLAAASAALAAAANHPSTCTGGSNGGGRWSNGGGGGGGGNGNGGGGPERLRGGGAAPSRNDDDDKDSKKPPKVKHITLTLVSFAVTRKAYARITQAFSEKYERETGISVRWRLSFGGSGTQARAICDGLPGDVVALALPLDVQKISDAGLIDPDWRERAPNGAVVAESVVGIVVREGNPLGIKGWDDLARGQKQQQRSSSSSSSSSSSFSSSSSSSSSSDPADNEALPQRALNVITANPKTGGGARWNFLALWGHRAKPRSDAGDAAAAAFCEAVFRNVSIQPRDAREASDAFYNQGKGERNRGV